MQVFSKKLFHIQVVILYTTCSNVKAFCILSKVSLCANFIRLANGDCYILQLLPIGFLVEVHFVFHDIRTGSLKRLGCILGELPKANQVSAQ
jgi:hypothetical protein